MKVGLNKIKKFALVGIICALFFACFANILAGNLKQNNQNKPYCEATKEDSLAEISAKNLATTQNMEDCAIYGKKETTFDENGVLEIQLVSFGGASNVSLSAGSEKYVVLHAQKRGDTITNTITANGEQTTIVASLDAEYVLGEVLTNSNDCVYVSGEKYFVGGGMAASRQDGLEAQNAAALSSSSAQVLYFTGGTLKISGSKTYTPKTVDGEAKPGRAIYQTGGELTLSGISISGFKANGEFGGAIYQTGGSLIIKDGATIEGCSASEGGAIYSAGSLELSSAEITNCTSSGLGGGVYSAKELSISSAATISTTNSYAIAAIGTFSLKSDATISGAVAGIYLSDNSYINLGTAVSSDYTIYKNNLTCYDENTADTSKIAYSTTASNLTAAASHFSVTNYKTNYDNEVLNNYLYCRYKFYKVTISVNNTAYGSVSSSSVSARYGTSVTTSSATTSGTLSLGSTTITATPTTTNAQYSYTFKSWENVPSTITADTSIIATFNRTTRTYSCYVDAWVSTTENGGYSTGAYGSSGGTASITYNSSTATTDSSNNYVSKTVPYNGTISVSATANTGYSFVGWYYSSGSLYTSSSSFSKQITGAVDYYAFFRLNYYTVTLYSQTGGSATITNDSTSTTQTATSSASKSTTVGYANTITLSATADSGYKFTGWYTSTSSSASAVSTATTYSTAIRSAANYYARFEKVEWTFSIEIRYAGRSSNYSDAVADTTGQYGTASVTYNDTTYSTSVTNNKNTLSITVDDGAYVSCTRTASTGYSFVGWYKDGTRQTTAITTSFTVRENTEYVAVFCLAKYTVSVYSRYTDTNNGAIPGGTTDITGGTATITYGSSSAQTSSSSAASVSGVYYGDSVTLTATPATGYSFVGWYNGTTYSATVKSSSTSYSAEVTAAATYYAFFRLNYYTVTIQSNNTTYGTVNTSSVSSVPHGTTISTSGNTLTINKSTAVTVTATAKSSSDTYVSYSFSKWTNAPSSVTADVTITATFIETITKYTVTIKVANSSYGALNFGGTSYSTQSVEFSGGSTFSTTNNVITIVDKYTSSNKVSVSPMAKTGYTFAYWDTTSGTITGNRTITAYFGYTITIENISEMSSSTTITGAYTGGVATTITKTNATSYTWVVVVGRTITINLPASETDSTGENYHYGVSINSGTEHYNNGSTSEAYKYTVSANTTIKFLSGTYG